MVKCKVEGCEREAVCKKFCMKHYCERRYGRKTGIKRNRASLMGLYPELWSTLNAAKQRCYNPKNPNFKHYGARGIKVCDRWRGKDGLKNFINDIGRRPKGETPGGKSLYSLERIDLSGDYCPENCRWANRWEQAWNTTRSRDVPGVYRCASSGDKWKAELTIEGKTYRKYSDSFEQALADRKKMEEKYLEKYLTN